MKKNLKVILPCCVIGGFLLTQSLYAQITLVGLGGVGDQTSMGFGTVTTETFDEAPFSTSGFQPSGTSVLGGAATLTGGETVPANEFGGAGGTGSFFYVGSETTYGAAPTPATLTFNTPQTYFGMWWSAMDADNSLTITANGNPYTYNESTLKSDFPVLAGSTYEGNPTTPFLGQDDGEDFFYINFVGSDITSVKFDNDGGTGFEIDNLSILAPGVPDMPGTLSLLGLGLSGLAAFGRRFRK